MTVPALICETAAAPSDLLSHYGADTPFFCSSPSGQLLAGGSLAFVRPEGAAETRERARGLLRDLRQQSQPGLLVGALPFDPAQRACLRVPAWTRMAPAHEVGPTAGRMPAGAPVKTLDRRPWPSPEGYRESVERVLSAIASGDLHKVVLARALDVHLTSSVDLPRLLQRLQQRNPSGFTFACDLPELEQNGIAKVRRVLLGASPELLVARRGMQAIANPLAGTAPRSIDPIEDRRVAQALLGSEKDRREHEVVVRAVRAALELLCDDLDVPASPSLVATPTLWHLSTRVTGRVRDPSISSLDLAIALHPTPAVCGMPVADARKLIGELEPAERGFFTGAVGYCDTEGQGEWVVAIRCAEVAGDRARLYAGAGIVDGSAPERELRETEAKLGTMLEALGL